MGSQPRAMEDLLRTLEGLENEQLRWAKQVGDALETMSARNLEVFAGFSARLDFGAGMNKGLTMKTGQTHVPRYHAKLLEKIEAGEIDPAFVITHRLPLEQGPGAYKMFRDKLDGCIKVVLKP